MYQRIAFLGLVVVFSAALFAQELTDKQRNLSGRYAQLEQILLRLAETSGNANPRQAALLKKALLESKDKLIVRRFETLVNTLERRQLGDAITGQTDIEQDLLLLLQLLESENRVERRDEEKEKIKEFLKDLEEILYSERMLKNQTQQQDSSNLPMLEKNQQQIRERAQTLQERLEEHEGTSPQKESPNDSDESAEQSEQNESDKSESQSEQSKQSESQSEQSESKQSKSQSEQNKSDKSESQSEQSESDKSESQSEQSEQSPQKQEPTPSQRALQRAMERMKQAEQKLKEAEKEGSVEEQEEAIAELQRLKEELEKILRQLREEELMQTLEKLEERFKRMLRQEQGIRSQTERLMGELANEADQRQTKIKADRLGIEQQSVIDEAESALMLLREDGTAQAMVESLLQARFDMTDVKSRLERTLLDTITLHVEDAVIDALQEMLQAVQQALEEAKQRQENAEQQESGGEAGEEPLIQVLAELRMIRSMQQRVNDRTTRYDDEIKQMLEKPDADLGLLKQAVEELARQQNRISRILHELKIGKTQ